VSTDLRSSRTDARAAAGRPQSQPAAETFPTGTLVFGRVNAAGHFIPVADEDTGAIAQMFPAASMCSVRNCTAKTQGGRFCDAHSDQLLTEGEEL
jgi:hypothetical protein